MPLAGSKPNEGQPVRHRVKSPHQWTEVEDKPFHGRHPLPAVMPDGRPWPQRTLDWWRSLSAMPHCRLWRKTDWEFAYDTALIAAIFHAGDMRVATEFRQREKILGTTLDSRRDLRIRYIAPRPKEERAGVTAIEEYRRKLQE